MLKLLNKVKAKQFIIIKEQKLAAKFKQATAITINQTKAPHNPDFKTPRLVINQYRRLFTKVELLATKLQ